MATNINDFLPKAYFRGNLVNFSEANLSIATHALHYGTAAFGGMRAELDHKNNGHIILFRPELHIDRLANSANLLHYKSPHGPLTKNKISGILSEFIASNPGNEPYYIRPLIYASDLGVAPRLHDIEFDFLVYGIKMGEYLSKVGVSCCFSSWRRVENKAMPLAGKISGSYINSALAKSEAVSKGYDEAIFLNSRSKVAEASAMNIFLVKKGVLITPKADADILAGITRRSVLEIAHDLNIEIQEREVDSNELLSADEVFLTGTAARITPVAKIENYKLEADNLITRQLTKTLNDINHQKLPKYKEWVVSYKAQYN